MASEGPGRTDGSLDRATDAVLRAALPELEPPPGMWARFEARLAAEPAPRPGALEWIRALVAGVVERRAQATVAGACVFLLAYRALWWEGGQMMPVTRSNVRWSIADHAFSRTMSEVYHQQTDELLDEVTAETGYHWELMDSAFEDYETTLEDARDE